MTPLKAKNDFEDKCDIVCIICTFCSMACRCFYILKKYTLTFSTKKQDLQLVNTISYLYDNCIHSIPVNYHCRLPHNERYQFDTHNRCVCRYCIISPFHKCVQTCLDFTKHREKTKLAVKALDIDLDETMYDMNNNPNNE